MYYQEKKLVKCDIINIIVYFSGFNKHFPLRISSGSTLKQCLFEVVRKRSEVSPLAWKKLGGGKTFFFNILN